MSYKSPRLLIEAIYKEMQETTKRLMNDDPQGGIMHMKDLRALVDELATMAMRPSIDDVTKLSPGEYVATMKPLVANYHRALMVADKLVPCLLEDLQAFGCILVLLGDEKSIIKVGHDPNHPTVALVMEAMMEAMDSGAKQIANNAAKVFEEATGVEVPDKSEPAPESLVSKDD
jgi:hypothetical protein